MLPTLRISPAPVCAPTRPGRLRALARALAASWRNRRRRRQLRPLTDLDPHLLDDLGLTAADVARAYRQPLSLDAGLMLQLGALDRGRRVPRSKRR